jgi:hypothetical protein
MAQQSGVFAEQFATENMASVWEINVDKSE